MAFSLILGVRPHHIDDLIGVYDGEAEDEIDNTDLVTDIDALVDAIDPESETLEADLTQLKSDIAGLIATAQTKTTVLETIKAEYQEAITEEGLENPCGRCSVSGVPQGRYPLSQDTGNEEDTQLIHCKTCNGFGYAATADEVTPTVSWPEQT